MLNKFLRERWCRLLLCVFFEDDLPRALKELLRTMGGDEKKGGGFVIANSPLCKDRRARGVDAAMEVDVSKDMSSLCTAKFIVPTTLLWTVSSRDLEVASLFLSTILRFLC